MIWWFSSNAQIFVVQNFKPLASYFYSGEVCMVCFQQTRGDAVFHCLWKRARILVAGGETFRLLRQDGPILMDCFSAGHKNHNIQLTDKLSVYSLNAFCETALVMLLLLRYTAGPFPCCQLMLMMPSPRLSLRTCTNDGLKTSSFSTTDSLLS